MNLHEIAQAMVAPGKGILAIDESLSTCNKRFESKGIATTEENRRLYRQLLVTAPVEQYLSGMILFDETMRQKTDAGQPFPQVLQEKGILVGIKVDTGTKELPLHPGELVTEGLDGLEKRLDEYKAMGATFAKWRAVITIQGQLLPTTGAILANTQALARYAAACQARGLVPMVEPEILMEGDHNIERCYQVSVTVWKQLFYDLATQGVDLQGLVLKTSMILPGDKAQPIGANEVAMYTIKGLLDTVPPEVAGVVFLSGGQSPEASSLHLDEMHRLGMEFPWPVSFSYGRGIQEPALEAWAKNPSDVAGAQALLASRAQANSLAAQGRYLSS